jgi:hypothetical protein
MQPMVYFRAKSAGYAVRRPARRIRLRITITHWHFVVSRQVDARREERAMRSMMYDGDNRFSIGAGQSSGRQYVVILNVDDDETGENSGGRRGGGVKH